MKQISITILLSVIFFVGCSYNFSGARFGDRVMVKSGPYEGCTGTIEEYSKGMTPCQFKFIVNFYEDKRCSRLERLIISTCDLKVIK